MTSGGRIWYAIDDDSRTLWITRAGTGHPKQTDTRRRHVRCPHDPMTVSAHTVAAALRERLPGLPTKKLHKLLCYCQGHHAAMFGSPLFAETISAWDMAPSSASSGTRRN